MYEKAGSRYPSLFIMQKEDISQRLREFLGGLRFIFVKIKKSIMMTRGRYSWYILRSVKMRGIIK